MGSDAHDNHAGFGAYGPGETGYVNELKHYDDAFKKFFERLDADGINKSNTLFVVTADENDHFAGEQATGCDGITTPCTYTATPGLASGGKPQHGIFDLTNGGTIPFVAPSWPPATDGKPFAFPDTPPGRVAASYLRAFNSGDPEVMRQFMIDSMAPVTAGGPTTAQRIERYRGMHDNLGTLTPLAVTTSTPNQLVLQLRPASGDALVIMTFMVEAAAPHRLESLRVEVN